MSVMILDAGNSIIKSKAANKEIVFPHAIQPLTEGEYQNTVVITGVSGRAGSLNQLAG